MARTICLLNQKGGVGKTSSAYHIGGSLSRLGKRILLVDNDPQASLTQGFIGPDGMHAVPTASSVAAAYNPYAEPMASTLIQQTPFEGISMIPGSPALSTYKGPERSECSPA